MVDQGIEFLILNIILYFQYKGTFREQKIDNRLFIIFTLFLSFFKFTNTLVRSKAKIDKFASLQKKLFKHALDQEVAYSDVIGGFTLRSYADAGITLYSATSIVPDFFAASIKLFTTLYMMMFINMSLSFLSLVVLLLTNLVFLKPLANKGARLQIIYMKV